ncbi:hypothetical protein KC19_2G234700, partial [Ceratodon purpureus]
GNPKNSIELGDLQPRWRTPLEGRADEDIATPSCVTKNSQKTFNKNRKPKTHTNPKTLNPTTTPNSARERGFRKLCETEAVYGFIRDAHPESTHLSVTQI